MPDDTTNAIINVDDLANPITSAAFKFYCRHLVALHGYWQPLTNEGTPVGAMKPFCNPGIILSIHAKWFFVTASHTLRTIDEYLSHPNARVIDSCLLDHFGPDPVSFQPIPFNYRVALIFSVHDETEGLDYGLVTLNSNQQAMVSANNIVPISEENWAQQHQVDFDRHIMLGLPEAFVEHSSVSPTMMSVTQLHDMPQGIRATRYPRFIGQLDDRVKIDIKGMSGGPIFGFKKGCNDRYWIVAIQSSWIANRKITFGCPVPIFARLVQNAYESAILEVDTKRRRT